MRNKGSFNFANNFEPLTKSPLDARMVVSQLADLTDSSIWNDADGNNWLYDGMIVSVSNDGANNGIYYLSDSANYTNIASWIKQGGATSGTTSTGTTSGTMTAINGLSLSGTTAIGLGGLLTKNTSINLNGNSLNISGATSYRPLGIQLNNSVINIGDYWGGTSGKLYINLDNTVKAVTMIAETEDGHLQSTISANAGIVSFSTLDSRYGQYLTTYFGSNASYFSFGVDDSLGGAKILQLDTTGLRYMSTPTVPFDTYHLVTKQYVDTHISGFTGTFASGTHTVCVKNGLIYSCV